LRLFAAFQFAGFELKPLTSAQERIMSIVLILSIGGWIATAMIGFYGLKECGKLVQIRKRMML
jgi:hypothetical protein